MNNVNDVADGQAEFEALVAQCLSRIRALARTQRQDIPDAEALALRVALIVSSNRRRGRVPDEDADPQTGVPDSYIDEVLETLEDQEPLLDDLRKGDAAAWQRLLDMLSRRAYRYLTQSGMPPGQASQLAQDLAQSAAVTLWEQALERFPYDTKLNAWVTRIVSNEVNQWRRSTKEQREQWALSLDSVPDSRVRATLYDILPDLAASRAISLTDMRLVLEDALGKLPSKYQREVIVRQLAGETTAEIAAALNRTPQAIYNLRNRAIQNLRDILSKTYNGPE